MERNMPLNNSAQARIDHRRRVVASLRLRGLTQREITERLGEEGLINPKTDEPYDLATVNRDLKALKEEWKAGAREDLAELRGKHLAEIQEARRLAWKGEKLFYVLKGLEQEAALLALNASSGEDLAKKALEYLDLYDKARTDAEKRVADMSE